MKYPLLSLFILFGFQNFGFGQIDIDHWETAIFADDIWSYRIGDSEPPADWNQPGFNDNSWQTGQGGFGYGDGDDFTAIPPTISLYIRINFDLIDTSKIDLAVLHADYDDAFVAYLNGEEIARGNFGDPGGTIPAHDDIPPTDHEAALYNGGLPEAFPILPDNANNLLQEGQNTLAIQIHNFLLSSSDFSSNFFLSLGINDSSSDYEEVPFWFFEPFVATNLPLVRINTNGQMIEDEPRIVADMEIVDNGPGNLNYFTDPANDYDGNIAIEIRGASSQGFPKKNYGFETQDANGENNDYPVLGMPEENDWILHGPFSDKSLIRNALSFDIGRKLMDYASNTRFCELIINGDYRGVYLMMERIKRDPSRVDISKLKPEDIEGDELTGGYIFQLDRDNPDSETDGWYSPHGSSPFYSYHSPDEDDLLPVQKTYLRDWMSNFENAMEQPNYASTYEDFIDVPSFIDYFLINELAKHVDAFKLSFYMYKTKDSNGGKLHMGPIWDFNLGYSNFDFACDPNPTDWIYPCTSNAFWLDRILEIPEMQNLIHCRWEELRASHLLTDNLMSTIDGMVEEIGDSQERNFSRWDILGNFVWPNSFVGNTHEEEIDHLKDWLNQRLVWMDQNMLGTPIDCLTNVQDDLDSDFEFSAFPNPFSDEISFTFKNALVEKGNIHVFNSLGQLILERSIFNGQALILNTEGLSGGIYFYKIESHRKIKSGKVSKF